MTADPSAVEIRGDSTNVEIRTLWQLVYDAVRRRASGAQFAQIRAVIVDEIFDAIDASGWSLLPPGGHSYIERGQYIPAENRIATIGGPRTGTALAGPIPHSHVRHVIVWPDYTRPNDDWARYLGPWQPVDTEEAPRG